MKRSGFRGRAHRTLPDSRPCGACGLAPKIRLGRNPGQFCLYYGTRIPRDEARELSALRQHCISDGNHFVWPVAGYTLEELLAWKMALKLKRTAIKVAMIVTLLSLALAPFGLAFNRFM